MNKIILFIFILSVHFSMAQDDLYKFDINGLSPEYIVVEIDSMTQEQLFKKTINWIKETYKNPDEVIKTTIENDKVRFEGAKQNGLCIMALGMPNCSNVRYQIEIAFKDGKYKFEVISLEQYVEASQYSRPGWFPVLLSQEEVSKGYYKKKGKLRAPYKRYPDEISILFNELHLSLKAYMFGEQSEKKKDDW